MPPQGDQGSSGTCQGVLFPPAAAALDRARGCRSSQSLYLQDNTAVIGLLKAPVQPVAEGP